MTRDDRDLSTMLRLSWWRLYWSQLENEQRWRELADGWTDLAAGQRRLAWGWRTLSVLALILAVIQVVWFL